ncbi:DUF362 domain-containing protein [Butyrivibrio sp. MC2021]|uniref:DUF362 domain-containing protein n=1 Tax=Butyrivibrio sp. MC2021 TaxID=1408306 RepID=UPI00047B0A0A|nr:DUF362 domain-containing protein [Butyrivibrio sp. MC2021]
MFDPVSISKCENYNEETVKASLKEVIDNIGGLDFVKPGMKVGIKCNLITAMEPGRAATTHPALLKQLCLMLTELGAEVVVGDSPGELYTPAVLDRVYKVCGLTDMVKEIGDSRVKLNDDFSISNAVFPEAESIKTFIYTGWLDKVDAIIDFCKLKTHAMMGFSCAVKNMFGTIPGTTKPEYHMRFPEERAFANMMVDLNEYFKPVLYLVDAVDGMEGNGPCSGDKRHIGALLASKRPYALDMVCADIIGMGLNDCAILGVAYERGLGPKEASEAEIVGKVALSEVKIPDFQRATSHQSITFEGEGIGWKIAAYAVKHVFNAKPQVKENECIGCKKCHDVCPAKAITMVPYTDKSGKQITIPQIDRSKCIKCFCCQEYCPKGAMKVKQNPIGKFIQGLQK